MNRTKWLLTCATFALTVFALLVLTVLAYQVRVLKQQLSERPVPTPAVVQEVRAQAFVLIDAEGKEWARLGFDRMGRLQAPGLFLYDKNGTKRLAAAHTGWGTAIRFCDARGRCQLAFTDREYWPLDRGPLARPREQDGPLGHPMLYETHDVIYPQKPAPPNWISDRPAAN